LMSFDLYGARIKEKIKPYFLRRRKQDVLRDLPEMIKQEVWLELDPDQRVAYDVAVGKARDDLLALGARVTKMDIMTRLQRLKQICNFAPGKATSSKMDHLKEQLEEIIESDQKVIVFSQYIGEGVDKLSRVLEPYGIAKIVGGQSESVRNDQIKKFKENRGIPILLASVKAGGVGLTLTEASYAVHFDHWWNPAVMWQAEARIHRPGQKGVLQKGENDKRVVNVYSYWMSDTIEERIHNALKQKGLLFANVVDGLAESQIEELISVDEWLDMFGVKVKEQAQPEVRRQDFRHLSLEAIREKLYEITPSAFENLAKELLRSLGFPTVKVTGQSHDGGIDVIAARNTADGIYRAVAQCKRYRGTVGVEVARELMGVIAADKGIQKGFLITTGNFSLECLRFCGKVGVIVPIYGLQVANYIKQFGLAL
jgi:HJR/Mrr/RecB family endonuclease